MLKISKKIRILFVLLIFFLFVNTIVLATDINMNLPTDDNYVTYENGTYTNNIDDNIKLLVEKLKEKDIIDEIKPTFNKPDLNIHLIKEDNYKLSLIEYNNEKYTQLIKEN